MRDLLAAGPGATLENVRASIATRMKAGDMAAMADWSRIEPRMKSLARKMGPRRTNEFAAIAERAWRFSFRSGMQPVESKTAEGSSGGARPQAS
jgi:hypothetical protein